MNHLFTAGTIYRWLALLWLTGLLLVALLVPLFPLPYAPDTTDLTAITAAPFTHPHWLGTDPLGRDLLAGLLFGARTTLLISLPAALLATLLGALVGSIAGFWGNYELRLSLNYTLAALGVLGFCAVVRGPSPVLFSAASAVATGLILLAALTTRFGYHRTFPVPFDKALLGLIALLTSTPLLILVLALAALSTASLSGLLLVLTLTYWPGAARLVRAEVLRIRALPYIESSRVLGLPALRILWHHIRPNYWHTLRATFPLSVATLIGLETTLSFLGVGLPPETASWGRILASVRLAPTAWWLILWPTLAILITTLALRQISAHHRPG
ncbi:hypothetical protein GCM10022408_17060 [Hymenobacter fastidiosus]|uniref:ABC transmembrane type-1 domain-containing protein n=1 Tax=Hymenobacter fastidiosus TaxID=486264 RepID=A0ABP7S2R9_9BACT